MSQQIKKFVYGASAVADVIKARNIKIALELSQMGTGMSLSLLVGRFGSEMGHYLHRVQPQDVPLLLQYVDSLLFP